MCEKIIEVINERPLSKGDRCWRLDPSGCYKEGTITALQMHEGRMWAHIRDADGDIAAARLSGLWSTKQGCAQAEAKRSQKQVESYKEGITDVSGLVRFLYRRTRMERPIDCDADAAAVAKAEELLGIDLEKEERI